jgi:hypothetical protein
VPESGGLTEDWCQKARNLPGTGARILMTCQGQVPEYKGLTWDGCQAEPRGPFLPRTFARIRSTHRGRVPEPRALTEDKCQNPEHSPRTGARIRSTHRGRVPEPRGPLLPRTFARIRSTHRGRVPEPRALTEDGCQNPEVFQSSFVPEADPHRQVTNHLPRPDEEYL